MSERKQQAGRRGSARPGLRRHPATGVYIADISIGGHRVQRSCFTTDKTQAQIVYDRIREELWRTVMLGERPRITWAALEPSYIQRLRDKGNRSVSFTIVKLEWLRPHLGHLYLDEINDDIVARVLEARRAEGKRARPTKTRPNPPAKPLQLTTLNRYWSVISGMLQHAFVKGHIDRVPNWHGKVAEPRGKARVCRWITQEQAKALIASLPEHIVPMARFALATGLRKGNVVGLRWNQVDLGRRMLHVDASSAKGKRNLGLPLSEEAVQILREQWGKHDEFVFSYRGGMLKEPAGKVWKRAVRASGIDPEFRWHDLRHTWASWHVQSGTPLEVLKELGGWASLDMVLVYAHLGDTHLRQFAENSAIRSNVGEESVIRVA